MSSTIRSTLCLTALLLATAAAARSKSNSYTQLKTPHGEQLVLADLDGDGLKEFVGWSQSSGRFQLSAMGPDRALDAWFDSTGKDQFDGVYIRTFFTGYFDSHARESVCFYAPSINLYPPRIFCFMKSGATFVPTSVFQAPGEWSYDSKYAVGDFDGDSFDEVLVYAKDGEDLAILKYNQLGYQYGFSRWNIDYGNLAHFRWPGGVQIFTGHISQYPNEGVRDHVLVFNTTTRQVALYQARQYNGSTTFWWAFTSASVVGANEEVRMADVNGDGFDDLVLHDIWYGGTRFLNADNWTLPPVPSTSSGQIPRFPTETENHLYFGILDRNSSTTSEGRRDDALVWTGDGYYNRYDTTLSKGCSPFSCTYIPSYKWVDKLSIETMRTLMGLSSWW
jgi:hypothetical protein